MILPARAQSCLREPLRSSGDFEIRAKKTKPKASHDQGGGVGSTENSLPATNQEVCTRTSEQGLPKKGKKREGLVPGNRMAEKCGTYLPGARDGFGTFHNIS